MFLFSSPSHTFIMSSLYIGFQSSFVLFLPSPIILFPFPLFATMFLFFKFHRLPTYYIMLFFNLHVSCFPLPPLTFTPLLHIIFNIISLLSSITFCHFMFLRLVVFNVASSLSSITYFYFLSCFHYFQPSYHFLLHCIPLFSLFCM